MYLNPLIFFVYPVPKGSEENQSAHLENGVNKLIFKRFRILSSCFPVINLVLIPDKLYKNCLLLYLYLLNLKKHLFKTAFGLILMK